jgi:DNA polymerase-3 subunit gamma/tau
MSYTVLARKYRSTNFDELVGQEHVAQTIKRAIESGRIAHAFLFCGTRGTGKTSTARILAKALNCQKSDEPTAEPCGKCKSCVAIARGDDMDVIEIDAASNTGVDNVRDLISNSQYRPVNSRFKIYIIDEVHMLSKPAFNALLKTLEEPPEHVKFILATTEAEKVLPTIQSRCQRYDFRNIPTREIAAHLKSICKEEKIKADDDALLLVAKAGAGSMRDSLSLLDRLLSTGEKNLTSDMIEQMLGLPKAQIIFDIANAIGTGDVKKTLTLANNLVTRGLAAETMVGSLIDHLHNLLIIRTCGIESGLVEVPGIAPKDLTAQAQAFDPAMLTQDIALLEELKRSLRTAQAGRALIDATLVRLALAEQFKSVTELLAGAGNGSGVASGDALKKKYSLTPSPLAGEGGGGGEEPGGTATAESSVELVSSSIESFTPHPEPLPQGERENDDLPAVGRVWEGEKISLGAAFKKFNSHKSDHRSEPPRVAATVANLEPVDISDLQNVMSHLQHAMNEQHGIVSFLSQGTIKDIGDNLAVIAFPETSLAPTMLERGNKRQILTEALSQLLGRPTALKFEIDPDLAAAEPVRAVPAAPKPTQRPNGNGNYTPPPPSAPTIRVTAELKEELQKDELIAAVVKELGGEIVKVE